MVFIRTPSLSTVPTVSVVLFLVLLLSRSSFAHFKKYPDGWNSTRCEIIPTYSNYECFNERECSNKFLSTQNLDLRVTCEECSSNDTLDCEDLINNNQTGLCCRRQPHCCTENYDLCGGEPTSGQRYTCLKRCCGRNRMCSDDRERQCAENCYYEVTKHPCNHRCVQNITSYHCNVKNETCFDMSVTIKSNRRENITKTFNPTCNPNDFGCMNSNIKTWAPVNDIKCWWRYPTEASGEAEFRFSDPCYDYGAVCDDGGLTSDDIFLIIVFSIVGAIFVSSMMLLSILRNRTVKPISPPDEPLSTKKAADKNNGNCTEHREDREDRESV